MPEMKEWTLMFYLASDNPLAPGVVSQLKMIKAAGFHPDANVVTQFDPFVEGTPTHIFEVNLLNKLRQPGVANVGFMGNDPFVRNLVEDKLWRDQKTRDEKDTVKRQLKHVLKENYGVDYDAPIPPDDRIDIRRGPLDDPEEHDPQESLRNFLSFCRTRYPARHFALFILGHGVAVGNDVFLFDEHADKHTISLGELGDVLREFKTDIDEAKFELVSFHSCSVSSIEVAFELKGTANYMLASQGPAFVGSWPYRSILIRIFNDLIQHGPKIDVKTMFHKIFKLCFFNAVDFLLAGYSFQLTLCNLNMVQSSHNAIAPLVKALIAGLKDEDHPLTLDVIQLAHLKSQSFYQEMYTDLYDFCFCISNKVKELKERCPCGSGTACQCLPDTLIALDGACGNVMDHLMKERPGQPQGQAFERMIVSAEFLGPDYQYSRGMSIYFPWTRPSGDRRILSEYSHYKFHTEFEPPPVAGVLPEDDDTKKERSWLTFLTEYFKRTLRTVSSAECDPRRYLPPAQCPHVPTCPPPADPCKPPVATTLPNPCQEERNLREDIANLIYGDGPSLGDYELADNKTGPKDPTGGSDCTCPSVKNFPRDTRPVRLRTEAAPSQRKKTRVEFTQADFLV